MNIEYHMLEVLEIDNVEKYLHHLVCSLQLLNLLIFPFAYFGQVLPDLMKLLAQLIVQLPGDGKNMVLNELYSQVAESDDVTRKPTLVSWLQSLSYLCAQSTSQSATSRGVEKDVNMTSAGSADSLSLSRPNARL